MTKKFPPRNHIAQDVLLIAISITISVTLARTGAFTRLLEATQGVGVIQNFIAGLFFTSAFTTPLAIPILAEIARLGSPFSTAVVGGLGAMTGDLLLFRFTKDRIAEDIAALTTKKGLTKITHIFETRLFRWFSPFVAALIIASPLPDELGVTLLGLAKTRTSVFLLFSFAANFAGILIISFLALYV